VDGDISFCLARKAIVSNILSFLPYPGIQVYPASFMVGLVGMGVREADSSKAVI